DGNPTKNTSNDYYYLPTNLRLSNRADGVPEFLFTKFTTESSTGVSGAIMHFLMKFGLTDAQQQEAEAKIKMTSGNKLANLKSQIQLQPDEKGGSFQIISATLSDNSLATSIVNGRAPLLDGGKVAVATRLTPEGAQLLSSTFEKAKSISDLSISLNYKFTTIMPAFKAKFVYDWERTREYLDELDYKNEHEINQTAWWNDSSGEDDTNTTTEEEFRQLTDSLMSKKYIYMDIRESGITDARMDKIREAFLTMFINQFTVASEEPDIPQITGGSNANADRYTSSTGDDVKSGIIGFFGGSNKSSKTVTIKKTFKQKISQGKKEVVNIDYALPIQRDVSIVGNLASWYNGVRDNKNCVNTINLNDPFFQHRDIRFIMDLEAKEMFEKEINYVTINARKKRSAGNNFEDRVTMDLQYFNEKGIQASMQYARGEDKNPEAYEYQVQWSLRGGNLYPASPQWSKGKWEGVTLLPPLQPKTIEFEVDPEEMKAAQISRVTLQVRYSKFGQEVEENIPISIAKKDDIVSQQIFMDRDTKGYAYRLVYNHKVSGKLATSFSSKINDYYVYASIPEGFTDTASAIFKKAKEEANGIIPPDTNGKVTGGQVLDAFKDIFGKKSK
ncbi:MAG: hypothetical protein ACI86C_001000, partial [Candidatus Latescibacterota bacterium]